MRQRHPMLHAAAAGLALLGVFAAGASAADKKPTVIVETSMGSFTVELEPDKAPKTVENFLKYVDDGFYTNTIFHRVMQDFMIQGGGFDTKDKEKETRAPVKNESPVHNKKAMSNVRGTIAMARTPDPNSATAQFFINLFDKNTQLDYSGNQGYTAFGTVIEGMDVVDKIAKVETGNKVLIGKEGRQPSDDVPVKQVVIKSIKRKKAS